MLKMFVVNICIVIPVEPHSGISNMAISTGLSMGELLRVIPSIVGSVIAFLLYKLNRDLRHDSWKRTLREFHQFFWTNADFERVRAWLACDESYKEIEKILERRINDNDDEPISKEDYKYLEAIDKFFALLAVYKKMEFKSESYAELRYRAFDEYWIGCLTVKKRSAMRTYVCTFYPELLDSMP